jgi:hypothetical protein
MAPDAPEQARACIEKIARRKVLLHSHAIGAAARD